MTTTPNNSTRFHCTTCGNTDKADACLDGLAIHPGGRTMRVADFERYIASRRPVDKGAAAGRREAIAAGRTALAEADVDTAETTPASAAFRRTRIVPRPANNPHMYRVEHPHTGAVVFVSHPGKVCDWVVYYRNSTGRSVVLGFANAHNAAAALAEVTRIDPWGSDYAVAPARLSSPAEAEAHAKRRAILAAGEAQREQWARVLIGAALDYLNTPTTVDEGAQSRIARAHVEDMIDQAMHHLGADILSRGAYRELSGRIFTGAHIAARHHNIAGRTIDRRRSLDEVERDVASFLRTRAALMHRIEAVTLAVAAR